jgi:DNA topoisomerase IA
MFMMKNTKNGAPTIYPFYRTDIKIIAKDDAGIRKQLKIIGSLLKESDDVIHAGDPDREGQLLVDWVLQHHKNRKPVKRLWLAAQDSVSIQKALRNYKVIYSTRPCFKPHKHDPLPIGLWV